jgi:hypothetical protein
MRRTKKNYPPITVVSSLRSSEPKFDVMGDYLAELSPFGCDADPAFRIITLRYDNDRQLL